MKNKGFLLIREFERQGKRIFSVSDAMAQLKISRASVMAILTRLRRDKLIVTLTNGLYAILEPTEQTHGLRPLRILAPFMKHLQTDYYVGLLSAANHWGAAHHKPQTLQVILPKRYFLKRLEKLKMRFFLKKYFSDIGIQIVKASFGYTKISSPELTALDIISYENDCGGFSNVCLVIRALIEEMNEKSLSTCYKNYPIMSSIQRLGYMMEKYSAPKKLMIPFKKWIRTQNPSPIPLYSKEKRKGSIHKDWMILENVQLEYEE
ncbi:MAG: hypothetical protein A3B70_07110 [Deltaproteobacteria bacterium RIFCSPHIGHO2_02_FULL_40_11]|nr:MAG: hypothetical protein A3B70_07110 [Deltaproteobacteria bacterium RIFCSPHIGHO2_02_FULL_40_11]